MPDSSRHPAASAGVASTASHLSIGEVLGLLLEEFPDVTISKIRFLESQGLIEPERTPSGYRKFFDHDVELLRLILREQRENFLPLRVIKDRIDSGEILQGSEPADTPRGIRNVSPDPDQLPGFERQPPDDLPAPVTAGEHPSGDPGPENPHIDDPVPEETVSFFEASMGSDDDADVADVSASGDDANHGDSDDADSSHDPVPGDDAGPGDALPPGTGAEAFEEGAETPDPVEPRHDEPRSEPSPDVSGDLVTASELAAIVSATPGDIADLLSYGLISPRQNMGEPLFDHDAVAVGRICARLLAVGVDVRHLRGWKTSADRETSVYEQLTLPLLRQRNPHGREAARDRLVELCELGTSLRQALVDAELRHHLER